MCYLHIGQEYPRANRVHIVQVRMRKGKQISYRNVALIGTNHMINPQDEMTLSVLFHAQFSLKPIRSFVSTWPLQEPAKQ